MKSRVSNWETIIDKAGCPIVITDALASNNPIVFVNSRFEEMSGYSKNEVIGQNPRMLHGRENDQNGLLELRKAIYEKRPCRVTIRDYRKDGTPYWVEATISPIYDSLGVVTHFIGIQQDISKLIAESGERDKFISELAHEVAQHETRSRKIIDQAFDAFVSLNISGKINDWNDRAELLFGWNRNDVLGKDFVELFVPEHWKAPFYKRWISEADGFILAGERSELTLINSFGREIPVEMSIFPIEVHQQKHFCAFIHDISARKEAELRIREFYALLSHELRSPLTSIRGALGLIEGGIVGDIPAEAAELIKVARQSSERLMELVDDILDLKKIESGNLELQIDQLDLVGLMKDAAQGLNGMAEQHKVQLVTESSQESAGIKADRRRLRQIFTNLISNGIKYSPDEGILKIKLLKASDGWRIEVTDQGPGIAPENVSKLFSKYRQLQNPDGKERTGTGLGLSISKALIEQHHGRIGIISSPGEGSTFWFELPSDCSAGARSKDGLVEQKSI